MELIVSKAGHIANPFLDRITVIGGDITTQEVDAIAIAVPQNLDFKGRINLAVQEAAGYDMDTFILENIYKPKAGEVYAIPAGDLPVRHILLAIMPFYKTEFDRNERHLSSAVRRIMEMSRCMLLSRIAIPAFYSGKNGFPKAKAARLISSGIVDRLEESFEEVRITCTSKEMFDAFHRKLEVHGWKNCSKKA